MPGFRVYMFGSIPFPVPAAEVERGMSCNYLALWPGEGRWRVDNHDKVILELNSVINLRCDGDDSIVIQDNSNLCFLSIRKMLRKRQGTK